jgi:hypothetical protein
LAAELPPEHSAAMTLGMLSGGMSPNTATAFNNIQSPGGTAYHMDLGIGASGSSGGVSSLPDFSGMFGMAGLNAPGGNPGSPFSGMFGNMGGTVASVMDFTATNFDWVSLYS